MSLAFAPDAELAERIREGIAAAQRDRNERDTRAADELAEIRERLSRVEAELRGRALEVSRA